MRNIRTFIVSALLLAGIGTLLFTAQDTQAYSVWGACEGGTNAAVCNGTGDSAPALIKNVINTILVVLGMIAVIMIIIGGILRSPSSTLLLQHSVLVADLAEQQITDLRPLPRLSLVVVQQYSLVQLIDKE
ncbi:MAG: hypothetical protein EOO17_04880 [Chloroflexi bacterium]|nr:MAG: hypothetical protein EOO17_04880 [Chloroflexota bacterium]